MAADTDVLAGAATQRQAMGSAPTGSRMHALYVVPTLIFNFAIILIPALLIAAPAAAQTAFQDTAGLDRAVASFTGHSIGEEGGARTAIDRRLKLAQCPTVALSWHGINHDAVTVTCSGPNWHVYVSVVMTAVQPRSPRSRRR